MTPELVIRSDDWDPARLHAAVQTASASIAARFDLPEQCEVTVLGCDDAQIAILNGKHRGKDRETNVLSWPAQERGALIPGSHPAPPVADPIGECYLGDIALAYETCHREAVQAGLAFEAHLTHLLLHGILHLLGYDHETDKDAELMEGLETEMLAELSLHDPYRAGAL